MIYWIKSSFWALIELIFHYLLFFLDLKEIYAKDNISSRLFWLNIKNFKIIKSNKRFHKDEGKIIIDIIIDLIAEVYKDYKKGKKLNKKENYIKFYKYKKRIFRNIITLKFNEMIV